MSSQRIGTRPSSKFTKMKGQPAVRDRSHRTVANTSTAGLLEALKKKPGKARTAIEHELVRRGVDKDAVAND